LWSPRFLRDRQRTRGHWRFRRRERGLFKTKVMNFKITNGTGAQLTVKAGKNTLILEPGKSTDFTLASGDEVVAKTRTKQYDEGQVLGT